MVDLEQVKLTADDWVRVRARTDGETSFICWKGAISTLVPGEAKQVLFNLVGMSAARCYPHSEEGWHFTSREVTFYLDPVTDQKLTTWTNPWTDETVTVVHVANSPVQGHFKGQFPAIEAGDFTTFKFDLFPNYPNPLAEDPRFAPYSPQAIYQSAELFKLTVPTLALKDPTIPAIADVVLSWDRIGQWLPWMKMGDKPGYLVYSAIGLKVEQFAELPPLIQSEVKDRIPSYQSAPEQKEDTPNMTSWLYFRHTFDAYLRGETFPLPEH